MEIKRNFKFEDYAKPSSSPETDAMWKMRSFVELFKRTLMDSIPAPYQHISVDEAMIKWAKHCGILPRLTHAAFNERLISKYLYKLEWQREKEIQDSGRRSSARVANQALKSSTEALPMR